jgi:hypothetical protein
MTTTETRRTISRLSQCATGLAFLIAIATLAPDANAGQVAPTLYYWNTGIASPMMMNNATGYCWLASVNGNFTNPNDYVNLTFDSSWNWKFTGVAADGAIYATALCQPWTSLTNRPGQAYFGYFTQGFDSSYGIFPPNESLCGIEGVGGEIAGGDFIVAVGLWPWNASGQVDIDDGLMESNGSNAGEKVWGQCAHFGAGPVPYPTNSVAYSGQTVNLGSSLTQMCVLAGIESVEGGHPSFAGLSVDSNHNYELTATNLGTQGYVVAACIPIRQP